RPYGERVRVRGRLLAAAQVAAPHPNPLPIARAGRWGEGECRGSAAWVRGVIDGEKAVAIDFRIDLGGRERSVAEKLLDLAQVSAGREQMGREGVAERVRGRGLGKGQLVAHAGDCKLDQARG